MNYIYYEQGQWRMFQAEELPIEPDPEDLQEMGICNGFRYMEVAILTLPKEQ